MASDSGSLANIITVPKIRSVHQELFFFIFSTNFYSMTTH